MLGIEHYLHFIGSTTEARSNLWNDFRNELLGAPYGIRGYVVEYASSPISVPESVPTLPLFALSVFGVAVWKHRSR